MTIYGLDISNHQSRDGFDVARARADGYEFLTHKMTEGTWIDPFFAAVANEAARVFPGRFGGYVFCRVDTPPDIEADTVVRCAELAGFRPGQFPLQIDYEDTTRNGSVWDLSERVAAHLARGWDLLPVYLPRWYWSGRMGAPDLSALPVGLWNSHYVGGDGPALELYPGDDFNGWADFGGRRVEILQFSERGHAAGESPIDLNAFRGTPEELDRLFRSRGDTGMAEDKAQTILEQEMGEGSTPTNATGWPAYRYHLPAEDQPRYTQTDYLRAIDAKVNSELPVYGDAPNPRPKPPTQPDDLFGHVLSLRAELQATQAMLITLARALRDPGHLPGDALVDRLEEIRADRR